MTAAPRFSVVMPAFNAAATISSAIGSVLSQTRQDLEVIVVDDGSTDRTSEAAAQIADPRVHFLSQPNRGPSAARNAGIAVARGTYISFLDCDDLYLPDYLERCEAALESTPGSGFAYTDGYVFDGVSGKVRRRTALARSNPPIPPPDDRDGFLLELLRRNFVWIWTMVPRAVLDTVGGFDESVRSSEDYDLWLRILLHGYRATWVEGQHVMYRKHSAQATKQLMTMTSSVMALYDRLDMAEMPTDAHRALLTERREATRRELRRLSRFGRLIPLRLVTALRRAGVGEAWYDRPPADITAAFGDLRAV